MPRNLLLTKLSRPFKYFLSIILALLLFFGLYGMDKLFLVTEIILQSPGKISNIYGLENYRNKNLVILSIPKMAEKIKTQNPLIKSVQIKKIYPHKLIINIEKYEPFAVIKNSDEYFYLSQDGRFLYKNTKFNDSLPVIYYYQKFNQYIIGVGDWITFQDIIFSLHFIKTLSDLGLIVDRVDINGTDMILCKIGDKQIVFTTKISRELQVYELEQIIRQFKIKGQDYKSIDLRFEKPVIKLN